MKILVRKEIAKDAWWYALSRPWKIAEGFFKQVKYAYQRVTKGYDSPATYNTQTYLSAHIPAILKELKQWGNSCPVGFGKANHALTKEDPENVNLKIWHDTLDEIIAGFDAVHALITHDSPIWEELYEEWDKRYPDTSPDYFEDAPDGLSAEWKTLPEYESLKKELNIWEREKQWRNEQLKIFHRGMILFHEHFMDLWD